jgi:hypothetical protein
MQSDFQAKQHSLALHVLQYNALMADFTFYENKYQEPMEPAERRMAAPTKSMAGLGSGEASPTRGFFTISQVRTIAHKRPQWLTLHSRLRMRNKLKHYPPKREQRWRSTGEGGAIGSYWLAR